jgi:hypothetical protein
MTLLLLCPAALAQGPSPSPLYVCEGNGFTLHSTASDANGDPSDQSNITFTWVQVEAPNSSSPTTLTDESGLGKSSLTIPASSATVGTYVYSCSPANDDCTDLTSGEYTVVVLASKPAIVVYKNVYCPNDAPVEFMITNWNGNSTYTWTPIVGGPGTPTDTGSAGDVGKDSYYLMDTNTPGTRTASVTAERTFPIATGSKTCTSTSDTVSVVVDGTNALRVEQVEDTTFCPGQQATFSVEVWNGASAVDILGGSDGGVEWYANENDTQELLGSSHYSLSWTTPDVQPLSSTDDTISIWVRAYSKYATPCPSPRTKLTLKRGLTVGSISGCICQDTGCTNCTTPTP